MQKIKNSVLDRLMKADLSRAELDFILHISHYQDNYGKVTGLYYRDVCKAIGVSYQTFYDVLHSLVQKGIITCEKEYYGDWNVTILDNSFENGFEGYISTGDDLFGSSSFQACKPEEKLLAMEFLKIAKNPNNGGKYRIGKETFFKKYCAVLKVSGRVLARYLKKLKTFFSIGIKDGIYYIRPLAHLAEKRNGRKDKEFLQEHISAMVFRRLRAAWTEESARETAALVGQYADRLKDDIIRIFSEAVKESIIRRNQGIRNKYKWNRQLAPRFIHKIMQEKMNQGGYSGQPC